MCPPGKGGVLGTVRGASCSQEPLPLPLLPVSCVEQDTLSLIHLPIFFFLYFLGAGARLCSGVERRGEEAGSTQPRPGTRFSLLIPGAWALWERGTWGICCPGTPFSIIWPWPGQRGLAGIRAQSSRAVGGYGANGDNTEWGRASLAHCSCVVCDCICVCAGAFALMFGRCRWGKVQCPQPARPGLGLPEQLVHLNLTPVLLHR